MGRNWEGGEGYNSKGCDAGKGEQYRTDAMTVTVAGETVRSIMAGEGTPLHCISSCTARCV